MKYFALIVVLLLLNASGSCGGKGLYVEVDGVRHTFVWGSN